MSVFSIIGRVGLDARGYQQGLASIRSSTVATATNIRNELGGSLRGAAAGVLGVAGVGAIVGKYKDVINEAARVRNQAFETGFSTDEIQILSYLAEQSGRSLEDLRAVMTKLTEAQIAIRDGNEEIGGSLEKLGINAQAFSLIQEPIEALKLFFDVVGKSDLSLDEKISQFKVIGGEIEKMGAIFKNDLSGTFEAGKAFAIPEETIAKLSVVGDQLTDINYTVKKTWAESGKYVLDFINQTIVGGKALVGAVGAGLGNLSATGSISGAAIAAVDDWFASGDEYLARKDILSRKADGIIERLNANTGAGASRATIVSDLINGNTATTTDPAGAAFDFFNPKIGDKFSKYGFSLSGQPNINFNPPILREQLQKLEAVRDELSKLNTKIEEKL